MHFRQTDDRPAGHVFSLPPQARLGDDPKHRPHFLIQRCSATALATLVHMTTKPSESVGYGAPAYEIAECSRRLKYAGQLGCFVSPVRLLFAEALDLTRSEASYTASVAAVRRVTSAALGIGTGLAGPGENSVRGNLAVLSQDVADRFGFDHSLVVTQHVYSRQRRWQLVVPMVDIRHLMPKGVETREFVPEPWDVVPEHGEWWNVLPPEWVQPVFDTARLTSFSERWEKGYDQSRWLKAQIGRILPLKIDPITLRRIEVALVERLGLPTDT